MQTVNIVISDLVSCPTRQPWVGHLGRGEGGKWVSVLGREPSGKLKIIEFLQYFVEKNIRSRVQLSKSNDDDDDDDK